MTPATFDTHTLVKDLKKSGFKESQAEALSTAFKTLRESQNENLATRHDLQELRHEVKELEQGLRHDMKELEQGLRHDMKELEQGLRHEIKEQGLLLKNELTSVKGDVLLLKWMIGFLIAGVVSLVMKAFFV